jgi:SAM-dependent methyltransferase
MQRRRFRTDQELGEIGYWGCAATRDLECWCRCGPRPETREVIETLHGQGVQGTTVLDIGAGVGAAHIGLLEAGAARAIDVDAAQEYLAIAEAEAKRRGLAGRVTYRYGDVVELAHELPPAEVVTIDSVICCYPYLDTLLAVATRPGTRLVGITYPHDAWWMRTWLQLNNVWFVLRRRPDHWYIHRVARIDRLMSDAGFTAIHRGGSRTWRVAVYRRT